MTTHTDHTRSTPRTRAELRAQRAVAVPSLGFRADIQGLRALAVTLVVVYHLWPEALPGGYIGVDVFFVISGFLISQHLFRELDRTGRVAVGAFWARRIRRLLPASLLVLVVTLLGTFVWMPASERIRAFTDIGASAVYIVNWVFAGASVDYLAQDDAPSVVQHYWSLAVEEQVYVMWPLLIAGLILALGVVLRRRGATLGWVTLRRWLGILLGVLFVASLVMSVVFTATSPGEAYFNTFVRGWEFAAGALVALAAASFPPRRRTPGGAAVRAVAAWAAVALIVATAFVYSDATPFPGYAALLPVAGVVVVIALASQEGALSFGGVSRLAPVARVGAWSYSIYLWHWPLIVLVPFALQHPLGDLEKWGIVAATVLLGALSTRFVEDPLRRRPWGPRNRGEFSFAVVVPLVIAAVCATQLVAITAANDAAAARVEAARAAAEQAAADRVAGEVAAEPVPCFGVTAILDPDGCIDPFTAQAPIDTAWAATDLDPEWCLTQLHEEWRTCTYGDPEGPNGTLALVGDSHAAAIIPAFDEYFAGAGWRVETFTRFACSGVHVEPDAVRHWEEGFREGCATWGARVQDHLKQRDDIDVVVYHVFDSRVFIEGDAALQAAQRDWMRETWAAIEATGKQVVLLRDIPGTGDVDIPTCLSQISVPATAPCSKPQQDVVLDDPIVAATGEGVPMVDLTHLFCRDGTCHSYIGGVVVYADSNHISGTYARSIAPMLGDAVVAALD